MLEKILVPLDGSELAEISLIYARELAIARKSELHLICSVEKMDEKTRHVFTGYLEHVEERFRVQLRNLGSESEIVTTCQIGEASETIIGYAEKQNIGLIIIASYGHSGIMPWSMGSIARRIIQKSPIPVLLARAEHAKLQPKQVFNKILVPLDGSEYGESALSIVQEIAGTIECEIVLFGVIESVEHVRTIGGTDYIHIPEQQMELEKNEAMSYLEKIAKRFTGTKASVHIEIRQGNIAEEIMKRAQTNDMRLIALSSHGKSGMTRWVLGSVSSKILEAGKTPFLLVKPSDAVDMIP